MPSYLPVTVDASHPPNPEIRSQGMSDEYADFVAERNEELRSTALYARVETTGRHALLHVDNAPEGDVFVNWGDGNSEVIEQGSDPSQSATSEHTYGENGTFQIGVLAGGEVCSVEAAINWPGGPKEEQ